jgi:hypothetical protein
MLWMPNHRTPPPLEDVTVSASRVLVSLQLEKMFSLLNGEFRAKRQIFCAAASTTAYRNSYALPFESCKLRIMHAMPRDWACTGKSAASWR